MGFCRDDTVAISEDERAVNAFLQETQDAYGPIGGDIQSVQNLQPMGESKQNNEDNRPIGGGIQNTQPMGESKQNNEDNRPIGGDPPIGGDAHNGEPTGESKQNNEDNEPIENTEPSGGATDGIKSIGNDLENDNSPPAAPPPTQVFRSGSIKRVQVAPAPEEVGASNSGSK